jgi:hypothetical protein
MSHIKAPRGPQRDAPITFRITNSIKGFELAMDDPVVLESVLNNEVGFLKALLDIPLSNLVVGMDVRTRQIFSEIIIDGPGVTRKIRVKNNGTIRFHCLLRIKQSRQFLILDFNEF